MSLKTNYLNQMWQYDIAAFFRWKEIRDKAPSFRMKSFAENRMKYYAQKWPKYITAKDFK